MHIRPAAAQDLAAIAEIANFEIAGGHAHFGARPVSAHDLAAELDAAEKGVRFSPADLSLCPAFTARYPWLVAIEGTSDLPGRLIGFAKAGPWKTRESYAWTTEIGVYVEHASHGRGVGRALYDALFPALESAGFRTILAGIALPNEASVKLHEALGMKLVGTLPSVGFKHGRWRDVGYWVKRLGGEGGPNC